MAHLGIIYIALALTKTVRSETITRTYPQTTVCSHPTGSAGTLPGGRIAYGTVQTPTRLCTVISIRVGRTRVQTFGTHKSRCTHTLPRHVIAIRSVEALTLLFAPQTVPLALAAISTYRSGITGRTNTLTRL